MCARAPRASDNIPHAGLISDTIACMRIPHLQTSALAFFVICVAMGARAQQPSASKLPADAPQLLQPEELVKLLQSPGGEKPLILQVGFRVLYAQAHIPGAEYTGAASEKAGVEQLRSRVQSLPRNKFIVLYCGCCPWAHCPNVQPAYRELRSMGFNNVKLLYIANDFGRDWVQKGYPVAKAQ